MTEFYWVLLALSFVVLLIVGCGIDKYFELLRLKKAYEDKTDQCEVTYEAMLTLIREFSKKELKIYSEKYSEILNGLYEAPEDNEERIKIYELLVEEIELRLSSLDEDGHSSVGMTIEA